MRNVDVLFHVAWRRRACGMCKMCVFPIVFTIFVLGGVYLFAFPITNVAGWFLFADYHCSYGLWGPCDVPTSLFTFLIVTTTLGFFIAGTVCILRSRSLGKLRSFSLRDFCCCYLQDDFRAHRAHHYADVQQGYDWLHHGVVLLMVGTFISTVLVGVWVGRLVAVHTVRGCAPFVNASIGFSGCVQNGVYVGGRACTDCTGYGFAIVGVPLLVLEASIMVGSCMWRACRDEFERTKKELEQQVVQKCNEDEL